MDFYCDWVCRHMRYTLVIECESTRETAIQAVVEMMEGDTSIDAQVAWWIAENVVYYAAARLAARSVRRNARLVALRAMTEPVDSGRLMAYFVRKPRSRRATFA